MSHRRSDPLRGTVNSISLDSSRESMSLHEALNSRASACLVVANLLAWSGWFAMRPPYGELECASLRAHREARDLASARGELSPGQDSEGDRLIFGRPIHGAGSEPLHFKALYAAN